MNEANFLIGNAKSPTARDHVSHARFAMITKPFAIAFPIAIAKSQFVASFVYKTLYPYFSSFGPQFFIYIFCWKLSLKIKAGTYLLASCKNKFFSLSTNYKKLHHALCLLFTYSSLLNVYTYIYLER